MQHPFPAFNTYIIFNIMTKKFFISVAACLFCLSGQMAVQAQDAPNMAPRDTTQRPKQNFAEVPNPEKAAKRQTDRMKEVLELTDKQYKKIYKLNLKEQKELLESRMGGGMPGPGRGGNMPQRSGNGGGMPQMPGGGGGGFDMGGGFPDMGGGNDGGFPQMDGERPGMSQSDRESRAEQMKKNAEKREKKMKKILTEEQYAKWKAMTPERPEGGRGDGRRPEGMPGGDMPEGMPMGDRPEGPQPEN